MPLDHYVPQVHLRKFLPPEPGHLLHAIRKSDQQYFTPRTRDVCRIEDGSSNHYVSEDRAIEEFLKAIEPRYNLAVEKLANEHIDVDTIFTIAGFTAYIITCSPTAIRLHIEPIRHTLETTAKIMETLGQIPTPPEALGGRSYAELIESGEITLEVDPKYPQAIGITSILEMTSRLGNFPWEILHNPFPDSPFFTSDFPAAIQSFEPNLPNCRIVPLTPELAIRIWPDIETDRKEVDLSFPDSRYRVRQVNRKEVAHFNRLIVQSAEDLVFFRNNEPWVPRFIAKNSGYRLEGITQSIPTATGELMIAQQRIRKTGG